MSIGLLFWLLMVLWFVTGIIGAWPNPAADGSRWKYLGVSGSFLLFVLLFLLGWRAFGFIIQG